MDLSGQTSRRLTIGLFPPDCTSVIREMNLGIRIIMISGYYYANDPEIKQEFAQRPYIDFVSKPFNLADIREAAEKALTSGENLSGASAWPTSS